MSAQNPERRVKAPVATPNPRGTGEGRGHARGRGLALAPPLRAAYLLGACPMGCPAPSGRSERVGPPPAYKSGAALQLAQFSLRPVTRTLRETHRLDSPW